MTQSISPPLFLSHRWWWLIILKEYTVCKPLIFVFALQVTVYTCTCNLIKISCLVQVNFEIIITKQLSISYLLVNYNSLVLCRTYMYWSTHSSPIRLSNWWSLIRELCSRRALQHGHVCFLSTHSLIQVKQYLCPQDVTVVLDKEFMHIEHCK